MVRQPAQVTNNRFRSAGKGAEYAWKDIIMLRRQRIGRTLRFLNRKLNLNLVPGLDGWG